MLEDLILEYLDSDSYIPSDYHEIAMRLQKNDDSLDLNEIYKTLVKLENDFLVIRKSGDKIYSLKKLNLYLGFLEIKRKGFGFVKTPDFDVFIKKDDLNGAINKDKVLVKLLKSTSKENPEGYVYRVLQHGYDLIVGNIILEDNKYYLKPDDTTLNFLIRIMDKNLNGAIVGHKVLVYIVETNYEENIIYGKVKTIIGYINDVGIDILSIVYKYGFNPEFSKDSIKQAKNYLKEELVLNNRVDLRDKLTITIDGKDAKDLDDAISLEFNEKNNRVLYVSIADVSYYVKEKSALDQDALARGTSVYLVDRVVPMLPQQLSNGICSLLPDVDRYTQTCKMEFDDKGNIISYDIFESMINSKSRCNYDDVNDLIAGRPTNYSEDLKNMLLEMNVLSLQIQANKTKKGMLNFIIPEPKIIVDKKGKVLEIQIRKQDAAEKLIESFMVIANESVASHIYWMQRPFIYRVHDKPNPEKMQSFLKFISVFNIKFRGDLENLRPKDIQKILDEINKKEENKFFDTLLLRSMSKAIYDNINIGHFGLASECYTHFTSPIRRYPDLLVHRLLRKYLYEKKPYNTNEDTTMSAKIKKIADKSSQKERDAIEAEREVNDMKMAEYMLDYIGQVFEGHISSITNFGFFVQLSNTVEGLVHISNLNDDYYNFNAQFNLMVGERSNTQFRIGQLVKVRVKEVSVENRSVDFELAEKKKR